MIKKSATNVKEVEKIPVTGNLNRTN